MALIRCSKCGNLASSRSAVCPICGEKIATEVATPPTTESTAAVERPTETATPVAAPAPTEAKSATPAETPAPAQPKTLNDILAARQTTTLNDTHAETEEQHEETTTAHVSEGTQMPNATATYSNQTVYSYDDDGRTVEEYEEEINRRKRMAGGFMIGCIILLLLFVAMGALYLKSASDYNKLEDSVKILIADEEDRHALEADLLRSNAENLVSELSKYKDANDSMAMRYDEAVKMLAELEQNNKHTLDQLRRYQKEVETLKGIMRQYVRQIDSLSTVATALKSENKTMKQQIKTHELRANQAEERADELNTKVRQGSVIQTSGIKLIALNAKSSEVKRMKLAKRLRVDFELTANALAEPGEKSIYVCITNPDGYLLTAPDITVFNFEGTEMMASAVRKVDYENNTVPVSIFYDSESFSRGTYKVDIYIDGRHCGTMEKYFD